MAFHNDGNTFEDPNGYRYTYRQIRKAMAGEPFPMSLVGEERVAFVKATRQGIDAHLEACLVPARGDATGGRRAKVAVLDEQDVEAVVRAGPRLDVTLGVESLPVLLRRLCETSDEAAENLAGGILTSLGFSEGKFVGRKALGLE